MEATSVANNSTSAVMGRRSDSKGRHVRPSLDSSDNHDRAIYILSMQAHWFAVS